VGDGRCGNTQRYEFPSDQNWNNVNVYPVTTAMQAQISSLTGLPITLAAMSARKGNT